MKLRDLFSVLGRYRRHQQPPQSSSAQQELSDTARMRALHPFHAVSVVPGEVSCAAAKEIAPTRFLSREAPLLPLPACTMPDRCRCRFRKYNDRRQEDRRLFGSEPDTRWYAGEERRRHPGRRSTDRRPRR